MTLARTVQKEGKKASTIVSVPFLRTGHRKPKGHTRRTATFGVFILP